MKWKSKLKLLTALLLKHLVLGTMTTNGNFAGKRSLCAEGRERNAPDLRVSSMTDHKLIRDLEKAREGSRELSDRVLLACGFSYIGDGPYPVGVWLHAKRGIKFRYHELPDPTRNLQDAVDWVVPEDMRVHQLQECDDGRWTAWICRKHGKGPQPPRSFGKFPTAALALCIASLKARQGDD